VISLDATLRDSYTLTGLDVFFFVALYFAIESAAQGGAAVWALNTDWMVRPFASVLESHAEGFLRWQRDTGIVQRETFTL